MRNILLKFLASFLVLTSSALAATEVVCDSRTMGPRNAITASDARAINSRIAQLEREGKEPEIKSISTSTGGGVADGRMAVIDKVCAVIKY